ncbi:MAG: hypothetical protein WCG06_00885 [Candidatus Omnitrophota bacterium]
MAIVKASGFILVSLLMSMGALPSLIAADDQATDNLIKTSQNPVGHMASLALLNNFNLGYGPDSDLQHQLKIQPTIPFTLGNDWSLITKHVLPVYCQSWPRDSSGLGNLQQFFAFVPPQQGEWLMGAGAGFEYPTSTNGAIGSNRVSASPVGVIEYSKGSFLAAVSAYNFWSFGSDTVNEMTIQPLLHYNLGNRYFLSSAPTISANWTAAPGERWTLPLGGGGGRLFFVDKMPMIVAVQGYYNVLSPTDQADWTVRVFAQFIFS